ncbi:metallophosphoesterase [Flavobacterium sp. J372]|uniref:metallophosphoesterase family protein n=1 Tax=Flavobacterium sp. J372 TaxID=2898436 RepID=UPI002150FBD8|nr:metallophosphoesterase [Flavobacterium sp. J372]MCR5861975.1 metallophosphoesterase [Flavobacterium sp. J372]
MLKRIAHITDSHLGDPTALSRGINPDKNLEAALKHAIDIGIDELIFGGDIGYDERYQHFFKMLEKYKPGFKIVLGNHDNFQEVKKYYSRQFQADGLYHSKEDEYYKYIWLNSSSESIGPQQMAWLESEVNTSKRIVIFVHHPVLGFETGMDAVYPLKNRDEVFALLQQCRQNVTIFCGHYHMPDKRTNGKITQYITPALSFQVKKNSTDIEIITPYFGYRLITLTENNIRTRLVTNYYDRFITGPEH